MKKALRAMCLLVAFIFLLPMQSLAESTVQVLMNGTPLQFDTPPVIQNDRVLVPMRTIFESLGFEVHWDEMSRTATGVKSDTSLSLTVGNPQAVRNSTTVALDTSPTMVNGRMMIPLRFVAESSDTQVNWDSQSGVVSITSPQAEKAATQTAQEIPIAQVARQVAPSVVTIYSDHTQGSINKSMQGSGVIISPDGYIATNFHVIDGTRSLRIIFADGKTYGGEIVVAGYDYARDIVILKIDGDKLPYAELGGDSNTLKIGDNVFAIGSPGGVKNTVSYGQIKGVNSQIINTSAKINHGSSGGALFNAQGKLIGIVSAFGGNNYYSIPIEYVRTMPRDKNIPAAEIADIPMPVLTPRYFDASVDGNTVNFFWEPVYGADYFYTYISSSENEGYTRTWNPNLKSNKWYWDYPSCFSLSTSQSGTFYMKIVAVKNNIESPPTNPIKVTIP